MRNSLEAMYDRETVNMIKRDSNEMESVVQVDLVKLIEEGLVRVAGCVDGTLLYQAAEAMEMNESQAVG